MKKIIFLDFDGVLHPHSQYKTKDNYMFSKTDLLNNLIKEYSDINIVISSSWRESFSLKDLKNFFPDETSEKIIGVTPVLSSNTLIGGRLKEIYHFCETNNIGENEWVALDDIASLFLKSFKDEDSNWINLKDYDIEIFNQKYQMTKNYMQDNFLNFEKKISKNLILINPSTALVDKNLNEITNKFQDNDIKNIKISKKLF